MRSSVASLFGFGVAMQTVANTSAENTSCFHVKPFNIDLSGRVTHMLDLIRDTQLPDAIPQSPGPTAGMDIDTLRSLRTQWMNDFNWGEEQAALNALHHYTAKIGELTIHFIHEKSNDPDAIPLILNHGWPGSFLEFIPIINNLTQKATTLFGKPVSFDIVVPSLPGFAFSSPPGPDWTVVDTARVFNTLMTEVLGYETYAVYGNDWGCGVGWELYDGYNTSVRAAEFSMMRFLPLTPDQLTAQDITLDTPTLQFEEELWLNWTATGTGYFSEQSTKPNDIGLALYDNPIGQLIWIGQKYIEWSDPRQGTAPSVLNQHEILRSVSLYYLTQSFITSSYIYYQNPTGATGFRSVYAKANTDAPLLASFYKYNTWCWPPALLARVGDLVYYQNHDFGGHFPGLDNPPALLADLREIATYWK